MPRRRAVIRWTPGLLGCMACGMTVPARAQDAAPEVPGGHPLLDYQRAIALFGNGKRDEATYWFYRGQMRFRIHLAARPGMPQDGDPALFASLSDMVERPVNEWAFGDVAGVAAILGRVLAWHAANDDAFTPKAQFPVAHAQVRAGLESFRASILADRGSIRAERTRNGLPNRT